MKVFEGGDQESGLNSDILRLRSRSRSGQGHGKVKLKKHHIAGKWLQRSHAENFYRGQGQGQVTVRSI